MLAVVLGVGDIIEKLRRKVSQRVVVGELVSEREHELNSGPLPIE